MESNLNEGGGFESEVSTSPQPEIRFVGDFNTAQTPFTIEVDSIQLGRLMRSELGIKEKDIPKTVIQFAARDVPITEGLSPITRAEFRWLEKLGVDYADGAMGLTDTKMNKGKRVVTILAGKIFSGTASTTNQLLDEYYSKKDSDNLNNLQKQFASKRIQKYLEVVSSDRARRFLLRLSEIAARKFMHEAVSHELKHAKDLGYPPQKWDLFKNTIANYGGRMISPLILGQLAANCTPDSNLGMPLSILAILAGLAAPIVISNRRHQAGEAQAQEFGKTQSSYPKVLEWQKAIKVLVNRELIAQPPSPK